MAALSNYLAARLLDHVLGGGSSYPRPSRFLALHFADPTPAGNTGTEINGGDYTRKAVTFAAASPDASNNAAVTFTGLPAVTITHAAVWDAIAGGNMLYFGPFGTSKVIEDGGSLVVGVTEVVINMD